LKHHADVCAPVVIPTTREQARTRQEIRLSFLARLQRFLRHAFAERVLDDHGNEIRRTSWRNK
jgi:hypothetical protein